MKNLQKKVINSLVKMIPVISAMAVIINANSTTSFVNGQPNPPRNIKKYRKF